MRHDGSLKLLLADDPEGFLRFGLNCPTLRVVRPVETDLPTRDRTVDGSYVAELNGRPLVVHTEFWRMHQSLDDLALDVGEAQVRLYRKERVPVFSVVWDLYGSRAQPVLSDRVMVLGLESEVVSTRVVYRRVNLRGMNARALLAQGPRVFYPLVPLTSDGTDTEVIRQAISAIEEQVDLSPPRMADYLLVLHFLADAEGVPMKVLQSFLSKEKMMQSTFYQEIFHDGEIKGRAEGASKGRAEALIDLLIARVGDLPKEVEQRILGQAERNPRQISLWFAEAALATNAETIRPLLAKISAP